MREARTNQVDVWRVSLSAKGLSRADLEATLAPEERERARRFHFARDTERFIVAHAAVRKILGQRLGRRQDAVPIALEEKGKPFLDMDTDVEFNLSHSADVALIAVASGRQVGVDVEEIRDGRSSDEIAARFFSPVEVQSFQALAAAERREAFFRAWVRKEAYLKGCGMGLFLPLKSFDVTLAPGEPARLLATRPDAGEAARWQLVDLDVGGGFAAAIAVEGQGLEVTLREFSFHG